MREHRDRRLHDGAVATANGKELGTAGHTTAVFQIWGTFVATITFEARLGTGTWVAVTATNLTTAAAATTTAAAGLYRVNCAGLAVMRARVSAFTSGAVYVVARVTEAGS